MKLSRIFFSHLVLLLGALFVVLSITSYYALKSVEIERYKDTLQKSILLMEPQLRGDLDAKAKEFKKLLGERITIIDPQGVVIGESDYDKKEMENHAARPEVVQARKSGWGSSVRYSATLKKDLLYAAKRLENGSFLRAAIALETIRQNFMSLWLKFLAIFALFVAIALWVSYLLSRRMDREISKIVRFLEDISQKNYYKLKVNFAKEFETIGEYLNELAKKLKKRDEKKAKFTKKLKAISRQRSELISAISHEFKNPVAIISGYAETLLNEPQMNEKLRQKFLSKIANASNKISHMIDRLSIAIKFENGDLEPKKSRFDLCDVAREAVRLMEDKYKERKIVLECEPSEVEADRTMMEMVIVNLLDNALKYSELEVRLVVKDGCVRVIDKGIGIKPQELEKITKKFYRTSANTWDNSMGLGLYIVSYILKLHSSRLEIDSTYKEGSEFRFCLNSTPPE